MGMLIVVALLAVAAYFFMGAVLGLVSVLGSLLVLPFVTLDRAVKWARGVDPKRVERERRAKQNALLDQAERQMTAYFDRKYNGPAEKRLDENGIPYL